MVAAVSMVRDEGDIIEYAVRRMAGQVDFLIVADNLSSDGTGEILATLADELPLTIVYDPDPGYYQSLKMTRLAETAAASGATWIVPFDADEVWLPRTGPRIADILTGLPGEVLIAEAPLFDHVTTDQDPPVVDPHTRIGWHRPAPTPLRKVAVRWREGLAIHQGNHAADFHGVQHPPAVTNALEVRHFPYRSVDQFVSKVRNGAAAYAATTLPENMGGHWRAYGRILEQHGEQGIADLYRKWFHRERPSEPVDIEGERQPALVFDPVS